MLVVECARIVNRRETRVSRRGRVLLVSQSTGRAPPISDKSRGFRSNRSSLEPRVFLQVFSAISVSPPSDRSFCRGFFANDTRPSLHDFNDATASWPTPTPHLWRLCSSNSLRSVISTIANRTPANVSQLLLPVSADSNYCIASIWNLECCSKFLRFKKYTTGSKGKHFSDVIGDSTTLLIFLTGIVCSILSIIK